MNNEVELKDIPGWEGLYAITADGRVYSYKTKRWLKPYATGGNYFKNDSYMKVALCRDGKRKQYRLHRLVAETFIPNTDNLPQVNHKDFNKRNNCVDNLEWCSAKYNIQYNKLKKLGE